VATRSAVDLVDHVATAQGALSPVTAQVDDASGWHSATQAPGDRPWSELFADLEDALEAWRKNFLVRRIVALTRSYTVGSGITLNSPDPDVDAFITAFWNHPRNRLPRRLGPIADQLTRDGELFPILFTNPIDGMSYLRFKTARQIQEVITDPDDYETELAYIEHTAELTPRRWEGPHPPAPSPGNPGEGEKGPLMLHWAVNKPLDATRGESDLTPVLPWALRYSEWLKDRVRLNRQRTRQGLVDVKIADDTQVEAKRRQLRRTNPLEAGIYVHGPGEEITLHNLQINADEAEADGRVLRLAAATGANIALHYLGEGEGTNYATAREMGEPTTRFYTDRQKEIIWMLEDLVTVAYRRYCAVTGRQEPQTIPLAVTVTEVARADNESLALAAHNIIQALAVAAEHAWIDDETALTLALKFAGETLTGEHIRQILAQARADAHARPQRDAPAQDSPQDGDSTPADLPAGSR